MKTPTPEEMDEVRDLARINNFLPDIKAVIEPKIERIVKIVCAKIDRQQLTPQAAFTAFHEIHAYRALLKNLDVKAKIAEANAKNYQLS